MIINHYKLVSVLLLAALILGCATTAPQKTSLELQAFQSREFETSKKIAFASVLSVFQDLGYIVNSADLETGFITSQSPTKLGGLFVNVMENTKATAFIEEISSGKTRVRLNFVNYRETSTEYGAKSVKDMPIEDPQIYQNAFSKIQEAIFIRSATE